MPSAYAGAEVVMCDQWIVDRLTARAAALDAVSAGLSTRLFSEVAPTNTDYPFIVYQCQEPPRDIRGVGLVRVMIDTMYLVKAVAQGTSYAPLVPIVTVIDQAMTTDDPTPVGDGFVFTSVRERAFSLVTPEQGTQFRHLGGEYRIHAQAPQ